MANRFGLVLAVVAAMVFACAGVVLAQPAGEQTSVAPPAASEAGDPIPGRYVVVLDNGVERPAAVAEELSGRLGFEVTHVYRNALRGFALRLPSGAPDAGLASALEADGRVDFVARDRVIEATAGQREPAGIDRVQADVSSTRAGNGRGAVNADVAILDSGIRESHRDLNVTGGVNCINPDNPNEFIDRDGHGTHVAGTAAAKDNGIGVVGTSPGARLSAVKVLGVEGGSTATVVCGIDWVTGKNTDGTAANDIEVANMSLGGTGTDDGNCGNTNRDPFHRAVCRSVDAGVFYAVAAGNESANLAASVPAAYDEVLTVTAMTDYDGRPGGDGMSVCDGTNMDDTFANFSNYATVGSSDEAHTIAGPGVCVRSTWKDGGYEVLSGTSMASPHVAGTAALCIANGPCAPKDPQGTLNKLRTDAEARSSGDPLAATYYGFVGDPNRGGAANYYGFLEYAGGY